MTTVAGDAPARPCVACGATEPSMRLVTGDRMFDVAGAFAYDECARCGCVQRVTPLADPASHYPHDYYAFAGAPRRRGPRAALRRLRNRGVFGRHPAGWLLARVAAHPVHGAATWIARAGVRRESRVLDVGCGRGDLLRDLGDAGYTQLLGIDPFAPEAVLDGEPPIRRTTLAELAESAPASFDLVMFHHALEHIDDQVGTLRAAATVLAPAGCLLVRVPLAGSEAWRHYREHWVQLDAPRHAVLHTVASLRAVGERAGLALAHVDFDSTAFQFGGSELYVRGIKVRDDWPRHFTRAQLKEFTRRARHLNAQGTGDQAAFYFRRG